MTEAIIAIVMAIISFFSSKKAGASDGEAALVAAGVGAGTYYVSTETEWGRGVIDSIESWVGVSDDKGPLVNNDGEPVRVPKGAEIVKDATGAPARDANGNVMWKLVDTTGKTLQSWGGVGTAAVIGAGALAADDDGLPSWVVPVGIGAAAFLLLK